VFSESSKFFGHANFAFSNAHSTQMLPLNAYKVAAVEISTLDSLLSLFILNVLLFFFATYQLAPSSFMLLSKTLQCWIICDLLIIDLCFFSIFV